MQISIAHPMPHRTDPPPQTTESVIDAIRAAAEERGHVVAFPRPIASKLASMLFLPEIATLLSQAHCALEGWPAHVLPLGGEIRRLYQRAATMAVRSCSEVETKVAEGQAMAWANATLAQLQRDLSSPDATERERERLVNNYIHTAIDIYRRGLANGADGEKHPAYQALVLRILAGEEDWRGIYRRR